MNHEQIKAKIDAIPNICKEGKKAVAELLKEFGYIEPTPRKPQPGELWRNKENLILIAGTKDAPTHRYLYFGNRGEVRNHGVCNNYAKDENWQYVGEVTEYLPDEVKDLKKFSK
jgi:hypothetical protein